MSDDNFFEDVFDTPDEDPLLQSEEETSPPDDPDPVPSWMNEEPNAEPSGPASPPSDQRRSGGTPEADHNTEHKTIPIDAQTGVTCELDELNEAVSSEWRIVNLDLKRANRASADYYLEVILEREDPQTLFEFPTA